MGIYYWSKGKATDTSTNLNIVLATWSLGHYLVRIDDILDQVKILYRVSS
jgi:hypothetical protein